MNRKIKLLYLSASPNDLHGLNADTEFREIYEKVDKTIFEIISVSGTQASALQMLVLKHNPEIIHFSGHASSDEFFFENQRNQSQGVPKNALVNFFKELPQKPVIVFFNACRTADNLESLNQIIDFVVATRRPVFDDTAIIFAVKFYEFLSLGTNVKTAFRLAENEFNIKNELSETDMYQLFTRKGFDDDRGFIKMINENNQKRKAAEKEKKQSKIADKKNGGNHINFGKKNKFGKVNVTQADKIGTIINHND